MQTDFISERVRSISESQTIKMSRISREMNAEGLDVINLSLGEPDFVTPEYIRTGAKTAIDEGYTFYTPIAGFKDLREAIAHKLLTENKLTYSADQIVVSTGAKQSIANAVLALINPGDEVIIPAPFWVSYKDIVTLAGGKIKYIPTTVDADFKISAAQLDAAITPRTRLIMYSSPCNPTGSVYTADELKALAAVIEKHKNVIVLSDEIYEYINFMGSHQSIAQNSDIKERVIIVNGFSKGYAMTGWRVGYIAAPLAIAQACDKIQGQFTSGTSSVSQRAALAALQPGHTFTSEIKEVFLKRRDLVLNLLAQIDGIRCNKPQGAFYVFPDVSAYFGKSHGENTIQNSTDFALYTLREAHVSLVMGEAFGDDNCVRISYATNEATLTKAVERIKLALQKLH